MATLLTVSGLLEWDETVLDGFNSCIDYTRVEVYPKREYEFYSGLENQRAKEKVVYECGMLECLHQDPETFKGAVYQWVSANSYRWTRLFQTTLYKYNAISNYDRTEEWEETDEEHEAQNGEGSNNGNSTATHNVGAYNNDMQKAGEDVSEGSSSYNATGSKDSNKTRKHRARMFGNIGVTTTQEMIESERRVVSFDIADIIAKEFRQQFCIAVY